MSQKDNKYSKMNKQDIKEVLTNGEDIPKRIMDKFGFTKTEVTDYSVGLRKCFLLKEK